MGNQVVFVDDPNNRRSDDPAHHYRTSDRRSSTARYDNGLGDYSYGYEDGNTGNYGYDEDSSSDYGIPPQQPPPPPQQPPPPRGVYGQTFNWDGLGQGQEGGKDEGQWAWKKAEQDLTGGTIASGSGGGIQVKKNTGVSLERKSMKFLSVVLRHAERDRSRRLLLLHQRERERPFRRRRPRGWRE